MYRFDISKHVREGRRTTAGGRGSVGRVSFRPEAVRGAPSAGGLPGQIDYRLARNSVVAEYHRGRLSRRDVCDAHPELLRAAGSIGASAPEPCPICEVDCLVQVSYAFGARLPAGGHSFATPTELNRLVRRAGQVNCYVVEVCPGCSWNHLVRTYGAARRRPAAGSR